MMKSYEIFVLVPGLSLKLLKDLTKSRIFTPSQIQHPRWYVATDLIGITVYLKETIPGIMAQQVRLVN